MSKKGIDKKVLKKWVLVTGMEVKLRRQLKIVTNVRNKGLEVLVISKSLCRSRGRIKLRLMEVLVRVRN